MKLTPHHSDVSWRFEWCTAAGHEVALRFIPSRQVWERLMRIADPVTGECGGWNAPQEVPGLPRVDSEDEAREVAERYASKEKP